MSKLEPVTPGGLLLEEFLKPMGISIFLILLITAISVTARADWEIQHSLVSQSGSFMPAVYPQERDGNISLNAVWGSADGRVFAVGERGAVLVWNGTGWQDMSGDTDVTFRAVWGTAGDNVYAVGSTNEKGIIRHYDGSRWQEMQSATYQRLNAVWGPAADDLFAVGDNGTIVHFNGTVWSPMASGTDEDLIHIHGISATDIIAVGRLETVLHYDGASWAQVSPQRGNGGLYLDMAWSDGKEKVLANASGGTLLQFDGTQWAELASGALFERIVGVWGQGETAWVAGIDTDSRYLLAAYSAGKWVRISGWDGGLWPLCVSLSSTGPVWVLGRTDLSDQILKYDGSVWETLGTETPGFIFSAVWGKDPSNVIAVGQGGMIRRYDGQAWDEETAPVAVDLLDVWAGPETDFFAVGKSGTVLRRDADGGWQPVASHTEVTLNAVRGDSRGRIYIAGDGGTILLWDGQGCTPMESGTAQDLTGIWISADDTLYVAGKGAVFQTYQAGHWAPFAAPLPEGATDFTSIWGTSAEGIWAAISSNTSKPQLYHYDGTAWGIDYDIYGADRIRGTAGQESFFIVRGGGDLYRTDGDTWSRMVPQKGVGLYDIWATQTDRFLVGDQGMILHQVLPDTTPPRVLSVSPAAGSTDFPVGGILGNSQPIVIRFSEPVDGGTLAVSIRDAVGNSLAPVPGSFLTGSAVVQGWIYTFAPETTYTVTVPAATRDFAANPMEADYAWSFTTQAVEDPADGGNWVTEKLWMRARINTGDQGEIEGRWLQGGTDTTARGDRVIWGYFYADPADVSWGNRENPDLFVKIWFDFTGSLYISYFHVSVPEIKVWSSFPGSSRIDRPYFIGNYATLCHRHVGHFYYFNPESGTYLYQTSHQFENGAPPAGYTQSTIPGGYGLAGNGLRIGAVIRTEDKGPIEGLWRAGGEAATSRGDRVLWGYFYADPGIMSWGSPENPDLFVKAWYDVSGAVFLDFFHVSVPNIDVFSELPVTGAYENQGTTTLENRLIEHRYWQSN